MLIIKIYFFTLEASGIDNDIFLFHANYIQIQTSVYYTFSCMCRLQTELYLLSRSVEILIPETSVCELIWKKVFTEVVKLKQSHTGSWWALNTMTNVLIRRSS